MISNGQAINEGDQVAYISPWSMTMPETHEGRTVFGIEHGSLTVSRVKKMTIDEETVLLVLDDGAELTIDEVIKTDGTYGRD